MTQKLNLASPTVYFCHWMCFMCIIHLFVCVPEVTQCSNNCSLLVLQQFIYLGFVHVLHVFQVKSQLLCLLGLFSIHLQDGVVSLLQILKHTNFKSLQNI